MILTAPRTLPGTFGTVTDPMIFAGQALTRTAASETPKLARLAFRKLRLLGAVDPTWFVAEDLELNADDSSDLRLFLASDRVRPLLSLTVASMAVQAEDDELQIIQEALRSEALRWSLDRRNGWSRHFDRVWEGILALLGAAGPTGPEMAEFSDELEEFSSFLGSPLRLRSGFMADLLDLAGDINALIAAARLADQVSAALMGTRLPMLISHSDVEEQAEFLDLYVPRLLTDRQTGEEVQAAELVAAGRGLRAVLVGNPGAGKTTFVRHLAWSLGHSEEHAPTQPAFIIRCRDYFNHGWTGSIVQYMGNRLNAEFGIDSDPQALQSAVLLGRFLVVFDGLDEIMQVASRSEFVARLESFAQQFPLVSILVTSRELGYSRTPIDTGLFNHFSLREFDDAQVAEYASKWFVSQDAAQLIQPFMRDSLRVEDLRKNPLLLSLLCILYRARGAIPRRRREIYGRCADLLFYTWDAHRQIEQPEELPAYGGRLMQEIARWVYKSPAAQSGLEEQVIERVIAQYLEGMGINEHEAHLRARDFLDFCAGRAWLLATSGTSAHGQRIFSFTHRTFYEYFTAEALSRASGTLTNLVDEVERAYNSDQTSVLPELIIQAYDERVDNGARDAFKMFCERRAGAGLLLRLMNGSLLSARVRRLGFGEIMRQWKEAPDKFDENAFDSLFTLEPNAYRHFVDEYLKVSSEARKLFAQGWSMSLFLGQAHAYSDDIANEAYGLVSELAEEVDEEREFLLENWLVLVGARHPAKDLDPYVVVKIGDRVLPGALWRATVSGLSDEMPHPGADGLRRKWLTASSRRRDGVVSYPLVVALGISLENAQPRETGLFQQLAVHGLLREKSRDHLATIVSLILTLEEARQRPDWLDFAALGPEDEFPGVREFSAIREWSLNGGDAPSPESAARVKRLVRSLPPWANRWLDGKMSFLAEPSAWTKMVWDDPYLPSPSWLRR